MGNGFELELDSVLYMRVVALAKAEGKTPAQMVVRLAVETLEVKMSKNLTRVSKSVRHLRNAKPKKI